LKIGLAYIKGAVPGFEEFGNIPTNLIKSNGLINGLPAHEELDALILPGGTLIESNSIKDNIFNEVKLMALEGKPIIGICAGYQILANQIDIGRKSKTPIIKKGLGLLDVEFSPLISNDRIIAEIANKCFLTDNINENITGFHCHTYGNIKGNAKTLFYSPIKRMNYSDNENKIISGSVNDDGNVIGTMIHNILDENPQIVNNLFNFLDASEKDIISIYKRNKELLKDINNEIGIESKIFIEKLSKEDKNNPFSKFKKNKNEMPYCLLIGSTGSDSGKTFITTGLAGALRRQGLNVAVLKVGPDIRDTVTSLYLTKSKMEDYSSIKIGHLGWMDIKEVLTKLKDSKYDIVLIEGVMSVFTGLLNKKIPYSAAEISISSNIPMLLISGVNKGGIESAAVDLASHAKVLEKLGINVKGILFNKVYDMNIFNKIVPYMKKETGINEIFSLPKIKLEERGGTPEVEIRYDLFSILALNTIQKELNIEKIAKMASKPQFNKYLTLKDIEKVF
jgi:cobyric acid synthase